MLEPPQIMALADLPSKEVLQAKLLGLLLAPASTLVRLINTPASQVAQVLKAYSDKGEPIGKPAAKEEAEGRSGRRKLPRRRRPGGGARSGPGRRGCTRDPGGNRVTIWSRFGGTDKGNRKTEMSI